MKGRVFSSLKKVMDLKKNCQFLIKAIWIKSKCFQLKGSY